MNDLSPAGWVLLICLGGFIVAINISLFVFLRSKNTNRTNSVIRSSTERVQKTAQTLRNPWQQEDAQWQELSQKVHHLKDQTGKPETSLDEDDE